MSKVEELIAQWGEGVYHRDSSPKRYAEELSEAVQADRRDDALSLSTFHKEAWSDGYLAGAHAVCDGVGQAVDAAVRGVFEGVRGRIAPPPEYTAEQLRARRPLVVRQLDTHERELLTSLFTYLAPERELLRFSAEYRRALQGALLSVLERFPESSEGAAS